MQHIWKKERKKEETETTDELSRDFTFSFKSLQLEKKTIFSKENLLFNHKTCSL